MSPTIRIVEVTEDANSLVTENNNRIFVVKQKFNNACGDKISYIARLIDIRNPHWQITTNKSYGAKAMFFVQNKKFGIWAVAQDEFFDYMREKFPQDLQWLLFHPEIYDEIYDDKF